MDLEVEELRRPIPVAPRPPLRPEAFFKYGGGGGDTAESTSGDSWYNSRDELLSATSKLNRRPAPTPNDNLSQNVLNVRYTSKMSHRPRSTDGAGQYSVVVNPRTPLSPKVQSVSPMTREGIDPLARSSRPRSHSPSSQSTDENRRYSYMKNEHRVLPSKPPAEVMLRPTSPVFSASLAATSDNNSRPTSPITITDTKQPPLSGSSALNDRYTKKITVDTSRIPQLAPQSKMNKRYNAGPSIPNGSVPNGVIPQSEQNGGGRRYIPNGPPSDKTRSSRYTGGNPRRMTRSTEQSPTRSEGVVSTSNIDQWLDDVFDPVLDNDVDAEAKSLRSRIKGGRKKRKMNNGNTQEQQEQTTGSKEMNGVDEMNSWIESLFNNVMEFNSVGTGSVEEFDSSGHRLERRLKGGGDQFNPAQVYCVSYILHMYHIEL